MGLLHRNFAGGTTQQDFPLWGRKMMGYSLVYCRLQSPQWYHCEIPLPSSIGLLSTGTSVGARYLTKLELWSAYNLVIREGDEQNTAFSTTTGQDEVLVLPYGQGNIWSVLYEVLRDIPHEYTYSDNLQDHVRHVRAILSYVWKLTQPLSSWISLCFSSHSMGPGEGDPGGSTTNWMFIG